MRLKLYHSSYIYICALVFVCLWTQCRFEDIDDDDAVVTTEEIVPEEAVVNEEINYESPRPNGNVYFAEHFDDVNRFKQRWVSSEAKKEGIDENIAKYDGRWEVEPPVKDGLKGDLGLVLKSKAKHAAISARLDKPFSFVDKPLIVQYEVVLQEGQECGGAYLKLLSAGKATADLRQFHDKTPYTIMFGPDKCGNDHKLHFIFRHKNPVNGTLSEKHCKKPKERLEEPFKDKQPHLYTLVVRPDNSFTISLDNKVINEGSLLEDFTPPVNPPNEIDDPNDKKPDDWDEKEKIPDPDARKPDDWDENAPAMIVDSSATKPEGWLEDEPEMIPDPNAEKPDDWDTDMDGDWEAPLIPNPVCEKAPGCGPWKPPMVANPAYKGKWRAPLIDNPNYKGKWKPRRIPNPDFFEDKSPFKMTTISAVGFELWSMSNMILFDNIIVTDDPAVAERWAAETFILKRRKIDKDSETLWESAMRAMNYKPGWWALYFLYCIVPIAIYVWYLCRRVSEERDEHRRTAEAKKTDAISPDDNIEEIQELKPRNNVPTSKSDLEVPEEEEEEEEEEKTATAAAADAAAESEVATSGVQDEGEKTKGSEGSKPEHTSVSEPEVEIIEEEEEENKDADGETAAGDAPRSPKKRRPRKE
ncbi:calnexin isoform X2 [Schistocerca cancellata]|uniref:calnexin isoform X2 n=1 Tax=Schistocerca cancellata TaxID=274614 RepID=UPI0021187E58|nr:calnexin isoform X2 [Schistocerca cancellata]